MEKRSLQTIKRSVIYNKNIELDHLFIENELFICFKNIDFNLTLER